MTPAVNSIFVMGPICDLYLRLLLLFMPHDDTHHPYLLLHYHLRILRRVVSVFHLHTVSLHPPLPLRVRPL